MNIGKISLFIIFTMYIYTLASFSYAAALEKKVAVAGFINIENKATVQYLEKSITDAVENNLEERFVFNKVNRNEINKTAEDNFLFHNDLSNFSVALNLGLRLQCDVVVTGNYIIRSFPKGDVLVLRVIIIDVGQKKVKDDFTLEGPADNRVWTTVQKTADRIQTAMTAILPNKKVRPKLFASEDTFANEKPEVKEASVDRFSFIRFGIGEGQSQRRFDGDLPGFVNLSLDIYPYRIRFEKGWGFDLLFRYESLVINSKDQRIPRKLAQKDGIPVSGSDKPFLYHYDFYKIIIGSRYLSPYIMPNIQLQGYFSLAYQFLRFKTDYKVGNRPGSYDVHSYYGILAAAGFEVAPFNYAGFYGEAAYGYSPINFSGRRINADGFYLMIGSSFRTALY